MPFSKKIQRVSPNFATEGPHPKKPDQKQHSGKNPSNICLYSFPKTDKKSSNHSNQGTTDRPKHQKESQKKPNDFEGDLPQVFVSVKNKKPIKTVSIILSEEVQDIIPLFRDTEPKRAAQDFLRRWGLEKEKQIFKYVFQKIQKELSNLVQETNYEDPLASSKNKGMIFGSENHKKGAYEPHEHANVWDKHQKGLGKSINTGSAQIRKIKVETKARIDTGLPKGTGFAKSGSRDRLLGMQKQAPNVKSAAQLREKIAERFNGGSTNDPDASGGSWQKNKDMQRSEKQNERSKMSTSPLGRSLHKQTKATPERDKSSQNGRGLSANVRESRIDRGQNAEEEERETRSIKKINGAQNKSNGITDKIKKAEAPMQWARQEG